MTNTEENCANCKKSRNGMTCLDSECSGFVPKKLPPIKKRITTRFCPLCDYTLRDVGWMNKEYKWMCLNPDCSYKY